MNRTIRLALLHCAAFALSSVVLSANANEYYVQDRITEDLHTACQDFSITSDGVFKALCIMYTSVGPVQREIDLDDHIGNDLYSDDLAWDRTNFSDKCNSLTVSVHASGVTLKGHCDRGNRAIVLRAGASSIWKVWKELNLNDGIKSDSSERGKLKKR